jgi:hypothetical protein
MTHAAGEMQCGGITCDRFEQNCCFDRCVRGAEGDARVLSLQDDGRYIGSGPWLHDEQGLDGVSLDSRQCGQGAGSLCHDSRNVTSEITQ